jgi:hypothetical protein
VPQSLLYSGTVLKADFHYRAFMQQAGKKACKAQILYFGLARFTVTTLTWAVRPGGTRQ